jgi:uncharacterized RDD family membrane protein YckC
MASKESDLVYAGFWQRFGAALLDTLLIYLIMFSLLLLVYGTVYLDDPSANWGLAQVLISYGLPITLTLLFWIKKAATPGKMAIGATIVDARTGEQPTTGQFVIRYFAYIVSTLPLFLGYLWVVFDSRKQAWHDKLAGTVVVQRKAGASDPVRFETPQTTPTA